MRKHRSSGIGRGPGVVAGLGLTLALLGTVLPNATAASAPGTIEPVSVASDGTQRNSLPTGSTTACSIEATNGKCTKRTVSDDGNSVVFSSKAPNLTPGDTNGVSDVFLWRRTPPAGEQNVISLTPGGNAPSSFATISPDGQWVAFETKASNLAGANGPVGEGGPGFADVALYNVANKNMHLVNVPTTDGQKPDNNSVAPSVANNGVVAFGSFATNLVLPKGNGGFQQVYVNMAPTAGGKSEMISVNGAGDPGGGPAKEAWIDAEGQKVAFTSFDALDPNEDINVDDDDIFVRNLGPTPSTTRLTKDAQANQPSISPDGTTVAFIAELSLTGEDNESTTLRKDIYTISSAGAGLKLVSKCTGCSDITDRPAVVPSMADGGVVAFQSAARFIQGVTSEQVWTGGGPSLVSSIGAGPTLKMADDVAEAASISRDGNYIAFTSVATNLVPGDFNNAEDVFLWKKPVDANTPAEIIRVSVGKSGVEASGFQTTPNTPPALSADGKVVAFESDSDNLVAGDGNGVGDIFVRAGGVTTRISNGPAGEANGASFRPAISADGNLIVFESVASNLVAAGDTNNAADIYLFDRSKGEMKRISLSTYGEQPNVSAINAAISPNGQWIAFESTGRFSDIPVPTVPRAIQHVYRYNTVSKATELVSRSGDNQGQPQSRPSFDPSIADNGSVALVSRSRNWSAEVDGTPQARADDIFVVRADLSVVKVSDNGDDDSSEPAISGDGQHVAYTSLSNNLAGPVNADTDVFVRNLAGGTRLVSAGLQGVAANGASSAPAINYDGKFIAFASGASNLVPGDNSPQDVFLADMSNGVINKVSVRPGVEGHQPNESSYNPALSASGLIIGFKSKASNFIDGDNNGAFDTFLRDLAGIPPVACSVNCLPGGGGGGGGGGVPASGLGYRFVAADGGIFTYDQAFAGSAGDQKLNKPIVGMAGTPSAGGYWLVASDGGIFSYGDAGFHGSAGDVKLNSPIVGMASHPGGQGYWFVAADGGIFAFGKAGFHGSMGGKALNKPIVAMASSRSGNGYWLVASDGGIFAFGDAPFKGSTGDVKLNKPIVGMDRSTGGEGYRFVASDGGIFTFGDASFKGSTGDVKLNKPIVGMAKSRVGDGYWLVASDGGIFSFGEAPFKGSAGAVKLNSPIVGMSS